MPSTFTPNLQVELQAFNENPDTWGLKANGVFSCFDQAIAGVVTIDLSLGSVTLSASQGATDQARNATFYFTGQPTGPVNVYLPARAARFVAINLCSQAVTLQVVGTSANTLTLPPGQNPKLFSAPTLDCVCDGVGVFKATTSFPIDLVIHTTQPDANANLLWDSPKKAWVAFTDHAGPLLDGNGSEDFFLVNYTDDSRVSMRCAAADGTVSMPNGIINDDGYNTQGFAVSELGFITISTGSAPVGWNYLQMHNGGGWIGGITTDGSQVFYTSASDYRLKLDYGRYEPDLPDIPVHRAAWKARPDAPEQPMFFAHEVAESRPWAVFGEKDAVDEKGNIVPQALDAAKLIPEMWARQSRLEQRLEEANALIAKLQIQLQCLSSS